MKRWMLMAAMLLAGVMLLAAPTGHLEITLSEETARALDVVDAARQKNLVANYVAVLERPKFPECGRVKKAIFYRKCEADGFVLLQLDIYFDDGGPAWTFVKNRDGQFAMELKAGWAVKGQDFQRLSQLEVLANPVYRARMQLLTVEQTEVRWKDAPSVRYVFRTPAYLDKVAISGSDETIPLQDFWRWPVRTPKEFRSEHATTWEYVIDQGSGLLVSRRTFNGNGQLLTDVNLGTLQLVTNWEEYPGLFATPQELRTEVLTAKNFYMLMDWDRNMPQSPDAQAQQSRRAGLRAQESWLQRLAAVAGRWKVAICVALGVCFLGAAALLKRHQ